MHSYLKLEYIPYQLETRVVKGLLVVGRVFFTNFCMKIQIELSSPYAATLNENHGLQMWHV